MGKKFNRLEKKIEHEYEKKGFTHDKAQYVAKATAGKIFRAKQSK